ncbi:MAG TPA: siderophore-interacting protein [Polyangiaceae bacterium]|nr:siderophore-interacting protein [Polyangiaceae bacterium]
MASIGKALGDSLKKLIFREVRVTGFQDLSASFRRLDLSSKSLRGARYTPGDKVQLALEDGPRTYSPFAWDGLRGAMSLLLYRHGDTSSVRWANAVSEGDLEYVFGPRGSLGLGSSNGPIVLFGDETSFGVARALLESRASRSELCFVFEGSDRSESSSVLDVLQLPGAALIERRPDQAHLAEVEERLRAALMRQPESRLVLTGKAQSIQALRKSLKARPVAHAGQIVKAYWSPGKRGLD